MMDEDFGFGKVLSMGQGQELNDLFVDGDGVVVVDRALEAFAQDLSEIHLRGQGSPCGLGIFRLDGEAMAVMGDELLVEVTGSLLGIVDAPEAQLGYESVLESAVDSLASSPGLGGEGEDKADAEFPHGPFKMSGLLIPLSDMHAAVAGGGEVGGAIQVEGSWQATAGEDLQADLEATVEVLLVLEEAVEGFSRGIIGAQDQGGDLGAEPRVGGAVEEEHLALLEGALPALAMDALISDLAAEAQRTKPQPEGLAVNADIFLCLEDLGEVGEIEVEVFVPNQRNHPILELGAEGMGWLATAVGVQHPMGSLIPHPQLHPLHLTFGQADHLGSLSVGELPFKGAADHVVTAPLPHRKCHLLAHQGTSSSVGALVLPHSPQG